MENITDIKFKAVRRDCSSGGFIEGYYVHIKDENRDEHYIVDNEPKYLDYERMFGPDYKK